MIPATESGCECAHHDQGEERSFLNQIEELPFVDLDENAIGLGYGGGAPRCMIDQCQFSEKTVFDDCLNDLLANHDIDFSFLYDVHKIAWLAILKNDLASSIGSRRGVLLEDVW